MKEIAALYARRVSRSFQSCVANPPCHIVGVVGQVVCVVARARRAGGLTGSGIQGEGESPVSWKAIDGAPEETKQGVSYRSPREEGSWKRTRAFRECLVRRDADLLDRELVEELRRRLEGQVWFVPARKTGR